ncbi:hypothetical protein [Aminiphilus circumscriptus]|uniref:hypothetical protein n=1 Tax=Aminiphilus circumscriptus TaxID=290732 RepID=UPI0004BB0F2A|nr:hypothetical protein [Aminiphilus circumscriptus]
METLLHWLSRTETGELTNWVARRTSSICGGGAQQRGVRCSLSGKRALFRSSAFALAQDARLVIANYHLFFAYTIGLGVPFRFLQSGSSVMRRIA